jgi:hypothetical protein
MFRLFDVFSAKNLKSYPSSENPQLHCPRFHSWVKGLERPRLPPAVSGESKMEAMLLMRGKDSRRPRK